MPRLGPSGDVGCTVLWLVWCLSLLPGIAIALSAPQSSSEPIFPFFVGTLIAASGVAVLASHHPLRAVTRPRRALLARSDFRHRSILRKLFRVAGPVVFWIGFVLLVSDRAFGRWAPFAGLVLMIAGPGLFASATRRSPRLRRAAPLVPEPWKHDCAWNERGESRGFWRYLATRWMYAGRFAAVFMLLSLRLPPDALAVVVQLALGVATSMWAWRIWRVFGMGRVQLGLLRFPLRTGERAEFTFGVSPDGADIRGATFTLRHFHESGDPDGPGGGLPMCDFAVAEDGDPPPRLVESGLDLRIPFHVPADAPGTAMLDAAPSYWEFEVVGETREGLYEERFLVPLYAPRADRGSA